MSNLSKAAMACENAGNDITNHFRDGTKLVRTGPDTNNYLRQKEFHPEEELEKVQVKVTHKIQERLL
ncbi:hypothetical protein [Methanolobus sp. WCC5]|uniref:hypothetical protein n=1 Tax=Methanolobus sp. WCC5 TaxID=3125785 RepID=UPI00324A5716